jgi:hypothetical protein
MRSIKLASSAAIALAALAGCGGHPRSAGDQAPLSFGVPVATGCVGQGGKPTVPAPLRTRYTAAQWAAMPPGAKAQAVAAQAGHRMNYEDRLGAATSGCR